MGRDLCVGWDGRPSNPETLVQSQLPYHTSAEMLDCQDHARWGYILFLSEPIGSHCADKEEPTRMESDPGMQETGHPHKRARTDSDPEPCPPQGVILFLQSLIQN